MTNKVYTYEIKTWDDEFPKIETIRAKYASEADSIIHKKYPNALSIECIEYEDADW